MSTPLALDFTLLEMVEKLAELDVPDRDDGGLDKAELALAEREVETDDRMLNEIDAEDKTELPLGAAEDITDADNTSEADGEDCSADVADAPAESEEAALTMVGNTKSSARNVRGKAMLGGAYTSWHALEAFEVDLQRGRYGCTRRGKRSAGYGDRFIYAVRQTYD